MTIHEEEVHVKIKFFPFMLLILLTFVKTSAGGQQGFKATPIFKSTATMAGQKIEYLKTDKPEITSLMIELEPGGEIGRHKHFVSGYVYVVEGTITIEMDDGGRHEFKAGESFTESVNLWHNAKNLGKMPVKLLAVIFGEEGKSNIIRSENK
jgi:quercetin dioxygenase-like cupin family protein